MARVSIVGAGAFGTALALYCAERRHHVRVWAYDVGLPERVAQEGENGMYLPGHPIPPEIAFSNDLATTLEDAELVLLVVPSGFMRRVTEQAAPFVPPEALITSARSNPSSASPVATAVKSRTHSSPLPLTPSTWPSRE